MSSPALPGVVDAGPAVPVPAAPAAGRTARWRWLGWYFGAWGALGSVYLLVALPEILAGRADDPTHLLAWTATSWSTRALTMLPAVWLARRFPLDGRRWGLGLLVHLPAAVACGVGKGGLGWLLYHRIPAVGYSEKGLFEAATSDVPFNIISYAGTVAAVHGVMTYRRFRERERAAAEYQLRASRLQAELAQAQLDALKLQLHPHFLFNTLHSISALIHEDPESADLMVSRLSDFLRLVLQNVGAHELPLREELDFVDRYLQIQHTRFGGRLRTAVEVEPEALDAAVPNLLLQPLVENAIRHAVEPREGGGRVEIHAGRVDGALRIQVRDDGGGLAAEHRAGGFGLGLANTRARLAHLYGDRYRLGLENAPGGGLVVTVDLPFVPAAATAEAGR